METTRHATDAKDLVLQDLRRPLIATIMIAAALMSASCGQQSASGIVSQFTPLLRMRDQAVANAAAGKATLDPASLNQLGVCYGDLGNKSDQYTKFIAGVVQSSSYDPAQNSADAQALERAIASYNDCVLKLQKVAASKSATVSLSLLEPEWVPAFGRAVESYWNRDGAMVTLLSPDARARSTA